MLAVTMCQQLCFFLKNWKDMIVHSLHYSSIVSLVKNTVQGPGYGEFSPDEISEMHNDPFANDPDVGEFNASMWSIEAPGIN